MATIDSDLVVQGQVKAESLALTTASLTDAMCAASMALSRSKLAQDALKPYMIPLTDMRVHDAYATLLPSAAANDDLGLVGGTFGTGHPTIQAGDLKAAGATTRYARFGFVLPAEFDAGHTVNLVFNAGMLTTVADVTCTLDVEVYKIDGDNTVGSDLYAGAAQSMNSLTFAELSYAVTPTNLVAGDIFDVRIAIACNDAATATAVTPIIGYAEVQCDVKG